MGTVSAVIVLALVTTVLIGDHHLVALATGMASFTKGARDERLGSMCCCLEIADAG